MLIAAIINFLLIVSAYIAILSSFRRKKNLDYDLKTTASKFYKAVVNFGFAVFGAMTSAGAAALIAVDGEKANNLPFLIVAACFGAFSLLFVFLIYAQFEAVKGNRIYIRRFARIREIPIDEVRSIDSHSNGYVVVCRNGIGFTVDKRTVGADDLIGLIRERTAAKIYSVSCNAPVEPKNNSARDDEPQSDEIIALEEIGREFRENSDAFKRKQATEVVLVTSIAFLAIISIGLLLFFLAESLIGLVSAILSVPLFFAFLSVPARIKGNIDKDLEHDDEWLGNKYKYQNPKVKGHSRGKFLPRCIMLSILCACSLCIGAITGGVSFSQKPVEESDLKLVSGQFEYVRTVSDDYAIGLKGDPVEYRIGSVEEPRFNKDFFKEVKPGDVLEVFIEMDPNLISIKYKERTSWTYVYTVKSEFETYFSYDDYVLAFEENRNNGIIGFAVSSSIFAVSAIGMFACYLVYKKEEKFETVCV
ncbi:MAG: HPP family protein [Bacilli bacterium]|nr:HPP family protein [Bacilli bacterium]